jgi:hypothetical protein
MSILLKSAELGSGWTADSRSTANSSACGIVLRLQPNESDLVETGTANSPLFTRSSYKAIDQSVHLFATPQQANTAWARTVTKNLVICMEQELENTSGMGSPVSVTDWTKLRLPRLAEHTVGFRVTATAKTSSKTTSKVYLDVILLGQARAMTKIVFSSLNQPFTAAFERRLAKLVSQRLTSIPSATS